MKNVTRQRRYGFLHRKLTKDGRNILNARRRIGRKRLSV